MIQYFKRQLTHFLHTFIVPVRDVSKQKEKVFNQAPNIANFWLKYFTERLLGCSSFYFFQIMGKKAGGFYAVARGKHVGVYRTWDDCKAQVDGFPNARYKKFPTSNEADSFIKEHQVKPGFSSSTSSSSSAISIKKFPAGGNSSNLSSRTFGRKTKTIVLPIQNCPVPTSNVTSTKSTQKRSFSSLKVTDDRVVNKRSKLDIDIPNKMADLETFTVDADGYVVVFTDGACAKNGRKAAKAGIGVWFGHGHPCNISEPVKGRQTNNTAEIQAAERAIKQAKVHGINKLQVKTDSQFTINCVTKWMNSWKRNNWRLSSGGDVKNKEDLVKLEEAMQNMEIKWSYVAGHAGIEGNEAADKLAVAGAEKCV